MRRFVTVFVTLVLAGCGWTHASSGPTPSSPPRSATKLARAQSPTPVGVASEFEFRRRHSASGRFITRDVLASSGDLSLGDVIRTHIVGYGESRDARAYAGTVVCGVDVYLDGMRIIGNLDEIRPAELAGVEYYQPSGAPIKYRRPLAACPVLLLWTMAAR